MLIQQRRIARIRSPSLAVRSWIYHRSVSSSVRLPVYMLLTLVPRVLSKHRWSLGCYLSITHTFCVPTYQLRLMVIQSYPCPHVIWSVLPWMVTLIVCWRRRPIYMQNMQFAYRLVETISDTPSAYNATYWRVEPANSECIGPYWQVQDVTSHCRYTSETATIRSCVHTISWRNGDSVNPV